MIARTNDQKFSRQILNGHLCSILKSYFVKFLDQSRWSIISDISEKVKYKTCRSMSESLLKKRYFVTIFNINSFVIGILHLY